MWNAQPMSETLLRISRKLTLALLVAAPAVWVVRSISGVAQTAAEARLARLLLAAVECLDILLFVLILFALYRLFSEDAAHPGPGRRLWLRLAGGLLLIWPALGWVEGQILWPLFERLSGLHTDLAPVLGLAGPMAAVLGLGLLVASAMHLPPADPRATSGLR